MNFDPLITKDLKHVWHPCSIMKNFEQHPPLVVSSAQGSYIDTNQGRLIDAISSWWCKSLGHRHPAVMAGIRAQLDHFEHVMPANTTHPNLVAVAEELTRLSHKQHVFFASDGACAVEIALKLAIQATQIKGHFKRNHIAALRHAYHGETLGALSVSDLGMYKQAWDGLGISCHFLDPIPYVDTMQEALWSDATAQWPAVFSQLERVKSQICAIIVEPVIQGANGLRPYSADFLKKLADYAKQNDIYLIADEIMTGLGRCGKWLASEHAGINPDMICLSKGLTSGSVPMSCVLIDQGIYELFYEQDDPSRCFLHSHTYGGNALAIAAALATLQTMRIEAIPQQAEELGIYMHRNFAAVLQSSGCFSQIRTVGAMVAADYQGPNAGRFSQTMANIAQQEGALLRPMDTTLYWFPPLNTSHQTIDELSAITERALCKVIQELTPCFA